jgi:hypothetical protein
MAYYRAASRVYIVCMRTGQCDMGDERIRLWLRMLIKHPEHTYGESLRVRRYAYARVTLRLGSGCVHAYGSRLADHRRQPELHQRCL